MQSQQHLYGKLYARFSFDSGDPPHRWFAPLAEGYAAALLRAGRPANAERIFKTALAYQPDDPHLLYGLALCEARQGRPAEPSLQRYQRQWRGTRALKLDDLG